MSSRILVVGLVVGLLTTISFGPVPAAATPCTNLKFLQLKHTTITSAEDNIAGTFTVPNSNLPSILTGLPALPCHSDANSNVRLQH
jgi:feruloyl esterase